MNVRSFVYSVENSYRKYFESKDIELGEFLDIELILLGFYRLTQTDSPYDAWSILTGYMECKGSPLHSSHERMLRFLHFRYRDVLARESIWEEKLNEYKKVDSSYRLFLFVDEGNKMRMQLPKFDLYVPRDVPKVLRSFQGRKVQHDVWNKKRIFFPVTGTIRNIRLFVYYQILKALPKYAERKQTGRIVNGKYLYKGSMTTPEVEFQYHDGPYTFDKLLSHRKKSYFLRNEQTFNRTLLGKEMGKKWEKQVHRSSLVKNKKVNGILKYDGSTILISGGVGVGKNAFIEEELYRLFVKEKKILKSWWSYEPIRVP